MNSEEKTIGDAIAFVQEQLSYKKDIHTLLASSMLDNLKEVLSDYDVLNKPYVAKYKGEIK